ncbi:putative ribonuclease H-like domain-containing protein [Tanacetum coccineum]
MTDYSFWEEIKNGNKVLKRTVRETEQEYEPTTAEEKQDRRNEMKARGTLLMALPNKDQLKFHSYKDAKLLMEAIEKSSETMDQTFDRLQKLITQLEIQGEVITQEDMNLKLLRSLPSEWKTHALIWRNKQEIETISLDDLYNNLKIYEPEISGSSSTSQNPQNVAFVSSNSTNSNSSTNEADNTAYGVSAAHTQSNPTSGDNLSDAVICAFLASQPNSPQLAQEDLEQIDPDDLEEMDLQWEMAMLTIRVRRFIKRTGRKLDVNGQRVRFDSYQAEEEHPTNFALMAFTSSGSSSSSDFEVDSCSKSCVKAYATLKEQYDSLSSDYKKSQFNLVSYKAGLESVEARLAHYKKNEAVYEESINVLNLEVKLNDNALVENKNKLEKAEKERDELKLTLEKFQNSSKSLNNLLESQVSVKFKTGLGYNAASSTAASSAVESFVNLSKMLENQENNKSKSDKGYHAVPPPYTGNFIPYKPDLTFMDEIVESENIDVTTVVTPSNVKTVESNHESTEVKSNGDAVEPKTVRKNSFRPPVIEDWNSDDDSEVEFIPNVEDKTVRPSTEKIKFVKSARETVEKVKDTTARDRAVVTENKGKGVNVVKASSCWGNPPQKEYKEKRVIGSGQPQQTDYKEKGVTLKAGQAKKKTEPEQEYILIPSCTTDPLISQGPKDSEEDVGMKPTEEKKTNSTNSFNTVGTPVSAAGPSFTNDDPSSLVNAAEASNAFEDHLFEQFSLFKNEFTLPDVPNVSPMDDNTRIFAGAYDDEDVGRQVDLNNLETTMNVSPIPTTIIDKDHPKDQIIGDLNSAIQTRRMTKIFDKHAMTLVDLPNSKRVIGTKWVFKNKKDKRGIVVRNKARLVAQDPHFPDKVYKVEKALYGLHQAPRAWYETLSTYLIKNGFRRGFIDKTLFIKKDKGDILLYKGVVNRITLGQTKKSYVDEFEEKLADILKKFDFATVKTASTPIETNKALLKDEEAEDVDVYLYRSMIRSLVYLIASRPDIMFAVCACKEDPNSTFELGELFTDQVNMLSTAET